MRRLGLKRLQLRPLGVVGGVMRWGSCCNCDAWIAAPPCVRGQQCREKRAVPMHCLSSRLPGDTMALPVRGTDCRYNHTD